MLSASCNDGLGITLLRGAMEWGSWLRMRLLQKVQISKAWMSMIEDFDRRLLEKSYIGEMQVSVWDEIYIYTYIYYSIRL